MARRARAQVAYVPPAKSGRKPRVNKYEIIDDYKTGMAVKLLAEKYDVSCAYISLVANGAGIRRHRKRVEK